MSTIQQPGVASIPYGAAAAWGTGGAPGNFQTYKTTAHGESSQLRAGRKATLKNSTTVEIRVMWGSTSGNPGGVPTAVATSLQLAKGESFSWVVVEGRNDVVSVLPESGTGECWLWESDVSAGA